MRMVAASLNVKASKEARADYVPSPIDVDRARGFFLGRFGARVQRFGRRSRFDVGVGEETSTKENPTMKTGLAIWTAVVLGCSFFSTCQHQAHATTDDVLQLSRAIVSEVGPNPGLETWAILHVLQWRNENIPALRHLTLAGVATAYCSELNGRARTARAAATRRLRSEDIPDSIEADVRAWLGGHRPENPCEGATDWASPAFVRSQGLRPMTCSIETANAFVRRR